MERGEARRRKRSVEPETERFRGDDPLQRDDAWRDWLNNHARQRDERLPGPFVTSVSREPMSPTQAMEGGLQPPGLGNSNGGARQQAGPGLDATRAHEVPVDDSLPSLSTSPGQTGETETNGQTNVETQLLQISQALVSLRSDLQGQTGRSFGALERRLEQLETRLLQCRVLVMFLVSSILGMVTVLSIESGAQYADMIVDMVHLVTARRRGVSGERDVLSRSEKWLPAPPVPGTNTWRD